MSSPDLAAAAAASEQLCYIHCNFCNIVLAVSVPCNGLFDVVTVRCGNCSHMWPLNLAAAYQTYLSAASTSTFQDSSSNSHSHHQQEPPNYLVDFGLSSSNCNKNMPMTMMKPRPPPVSDAQQMNNRHQEKKQRVPSLYNVFIKEEIQRIKANNPHISHKEAFGAASKNWAHFPQIYFGLMLENNHRQAHLNEYQGLRYPRNDKA